MAKSTECLDKTEDIIWFIQIQPTVVTKPQNQSTRQLKLLCIRIDETKLKGKLIIMDTKFMINIINDLLIFYMTKLENNYTP
jgi:hypothetical protein